MVDGASLLRNKASAARGHDLPLIRSVLARLPLFATIEWPSAALFTAHTKLKTLRRGEAICRRGEIIPGVIVLAYGLAKITLCRSNGKEKIVRFFGANEFFGESCVLTGRASPVDVVALEDSMVAIVPQTFLLRLIGRNPTFALALARSIAENFLALLGELESSTQHNATKRLARYLVSLAEPSANSNRCIVRLPASKTAVAARLDVTKETMSRLLRELANRGLIAISGRNIVILDRSALTQSIG